jgi:hypothetical protein
LNKKKDLSEEDESKIISLVVDSLPQVAEVVEELKQQFID